MVLYQVKPEDRNIIIMDVMQIVENLKKVDPAIEVQLIGPSQMIIEVVYKKKKNFTCLFLTHLVFIIFWFDAHDYELS